MEALKVLNSDIVVFLHPSKSNRVPEAIRRELGSLLFKFNESFDGVLLAYEVSIADNKTTVLSGLNPYLGVKLKAELLLFTPEPDMLLDGKVVKLSSESIHVVVLGFSSAIIIKENIREEFKYKPKHGQGRFYGKSERRHVIQVGTIIRFLAVSFDEEVLHFSGSLLPDHTGSVSWLDRPLEKDLQEDRAVEKKKRSLIFCSQGKKPKRRKTIAQS